MRFDMEINSNKTELFEDKNNEFKDVNSYMILSKGEDVEDSDFDNIIQIIDESGSEVSCTYDKFVEIFDKEGLSGFIL
jgi:hypothetical protein